MPLNEYRHGNLVLKNRIIRSATYEGMSDEQGYPTEKLRDLYTELAANDCALIITGFAFVARSGRAMQPQQAGIDDDDKIPAWREVVAPVHEKGGKILIQISHTGRQTLQKVTGHPVLAPSPVKCSYFRQKPRKITEPEIRTVIEQFIQAAVRAQKAGFDGVQIHAAHGYILHQFLSTFINRRRDNWGGSLENRFKPLKEVAAGIRKACGEDFIVLVKLSPMDDRVKGTMIDEYVTVAGWLEQLGVDGLEISYGMMEKALNIIRGGCPVNVVLKENMLYKDIPEFFKKIWKLTVFPFMKRGFIPFSARYNLESARRIKQGVKNIPISTVGGIRSFGEIKQIIDDGDADLVSLCRPFICEPDIIRKFKNDENYVSRCINCNLCTVYCDSYKLLRCYLPKSKRV